MSKSIKRYASIAQEWSEKSTGQFRHGAVCIVNNKVVSCGHNAPADPHCIRVNLRRSCQKERQVLRYTV